MTDECTQSAIAGVTGAAGAYHKHSHKNDGVICGLMILVLALAMGLFRKGRKNAVITP